MMGLKITSYNYKDIVFASAIVCMVFLCGVMYKTSIQNIIMIEWLIFTIFFVVKNTLGRYSIAIVLVVIISSCIMFYVLNKKLNRYYLSFTIATVSLFMFLSLIDTEWCIGRKSLMIGMWIVNGILAIVGIKLLTIILNSEGSSSYTPIALNNIFSIFMYLYDVIIVEFLLLRLLYIFFGRLYVGTIIIVVSAPVIIYFYYWYKITINIDVPSIINILTGFCLSIVGSIIGFKFLKSSLVIAAAILTLWYFMYEEDSVKFLLGGDKNQELSSDYELYENDQGILARKFILKCRLVIFTVLYTVFDEIESLGYEKQARKSAFILYMGSYLAILYGPRILRYFWSIKVKNFKSMRK